MSDMEKTKATPIPGPMSSQRISFAEAPPLIIKTPDEEDIEVPENITGIDSQIPEPPVAFEIPEELAGETVTSARTIDDENE